MRPVLFLRWPHLLMLFWTYDVGGGGGVIAVGGSDAAKDDDEKCGISIKVA